MIGPGAMAALPFMSPRLMGEAVHAGGRASGAVERAVGNVKVPPGASQANFQAGRTGALQDEEDRRLMMAMMGMRR